uniref:Uncharacterized protein n=1 Tax=Ditylenchus dipsaci TaxID=166011 RepID=A0A915E5G5_9BILA
MAPHPDYHQHAILPFYCNKTAKPKNGTSLVYTTPRNFRISSNFFPVFIFPICQSFLIFRHFFLRINLAEVQAQAQTRYWYTPISYLQLCLRFRLQKEIFGSRYSLLFMVSD